MGHTPCVPLKHEASQGCVLRLTFSSCGAPFLWFSGFDTRRPCVHPAGGSTFPWVSRGNLLLTTPCVPLRRETSRGGLLEACLFTGFFLRTFFCPRHKSDCTRAVSGSPLLSKCSWFCSPKLVLLGSPPGRACFSLCLRLYLYLRGEEQHHKNNMGLASCPRGYSDSV